MILTQQLITHAAPNLTKPALRYLGKEINYKDLLASISRLSYLYQHEIGSGVRMAFLCRNCPAMVATFFAMTNTRSVNIPIDPDLPPEEIVKWLKESKATHIAVTSDLAAHAREILQSERMNLPVIEIEKKHGGEYDTSFTPPPDQAPKEADTVLVLKSSGITGKPKFVTFTHKQLMAVANGLKKPYHPLSTDRFLTTLSWSHPFALTHALLFPLMTGACCVIDHGLQAVDFLNFVIESRASRLIGTPSFFLRLLVICKNEKKVIAGVKSITVGMGSLSGELKKAFDLLKIQVSHCYGQVENLWTIAMQDTREPESLQEGFVRGFVGKGLPGFKYKVLDASGDEITGGDRRTGPLAIAGGTIMQGYFEKEKETKMALRGTWLYTGDLARLEGEGEDLTITLIGRREDVIEVNDEFIHFSQIDSVIRSNPFVQDGAAFSVKNAKGQSVIVCAVVKKAGAALNEKQFLEFCAGGLPDHLMPKGVAFTDVIPRDLGNNVNCSKLRGQFSGIAG